MPEYMPGWLLQGSLAGSQNFRQGNLEGYPRWFPDRYPGPAGDLPFSPALLDYSDYLIRSYFTPIAWRREGTWHIPRCRYSVTTSRHQGLVLAAVSQLPAVREGRELLLRFPGREIHVTAGRGRSPYGPRRGGW